MQAQILILVLILSASVSFAQDTIYDQNLKSKANELTGGTAFLVKGNEAFKSGQYATALMNYEELIRFAPGNQKVFYKIAVTNLKMEHYQKCLDYLKKVTDREDKKKNWIYDELHMISGQAYQGLGKLAEALDSYIEYDIQMSADDGDADELAKVKRRMKQCELAQKMLKNPIDVKIVNAGNNINSQYDDYSPSVSQDGKTMILTSRRSDTKGGQIHPGDGKYFEDVYISRLDSATQAWSKSTPIAGKINTNGFDASMCIAPDGQVIYLYVNIAGKTGSGDIWASKLSSSGKWASPKAIKVSDDIKKTERVNSSYFESSATITGDGETMYFVSERPGGQGNGDIYMAKKKGSAWGKAVNLGDLINTEFSEISVFVHPDGNTLFFSSKGHDNMGGLDIFKSVKKDGEWSKPQNLGVPINTINDDLHFILMADNKLAYYSSEKGTGIGGRDIYAIDLSKIDILTLNPLGK